ncbi:hypothetical protein RFI_29225 [Reticulomyxa filosa]|uniref:Uncharacterized protein n=1 Tax=Reticulomyxa filosa TaxID=46433 RepID=X6M2M4_RETFI|nr:hypothetical protein RFI_29225 [Reticulomyxa filosa]|eukprot:ETO08159.1 hypothetical protein RFI_29225 [Reticulomyxa filosa]
MQWNCIVTSMKTLSKFFLIGEECLRQYLQQSNRKCPVGRHDHCEFFKSKTARQSVSELLVMCPRQYKSNEDLQLSERTKTREDEKSICRFKGEIKEVQHHLETSCQLLASRQNNSLDIQSQFNALNAQIEQFQKMFKDLQSQLHIEKLQTLESQKQIEALKENDNEKQRK